VVLPPISTRKGHYKGFIIIGWQCTTATSNSDSDSSRDHNSSNESDANEYEGSLKTSPEATKKQYSENDANDNVQISNTIINLETTRH
jgi:hypothetical protein